MATTPKKPSAAPAAAKPAAKKVATVMAVATKEAPAKVPAAKKVAAKKVTTAPMAAPGYVDSPVAVAPAAKTASATKTVLKPSTASAPVLSSEQRAHYVAVAAFYIAERRGFTLGNPVEDWLAAEAEVDRFISSGHFTI